MKLISFVIPCFNSEDYMEHAINSILVGGDNIEIIIVNDGSSDNTLKIARIYEKKYPNIIKVIDKKNGGHGSGVNAGLEVATGKYFKIVDSDDWVDEDSLKKVITTLKDITPDMLIVNYVYEKMGSAKEINYRHILPENKIFTWDETKKFKISTYLLMHSIIYKTSILKKINLKLPEHTFYVDNIFVYYPLPHIKKMYYLNIPFYRYFIGRDNQSVNQSVMIKRVDQQIRVTKTMIDFFNPEDFKNPKLCEYLIHYLDIMMGVSTILLALDGTKESKLKKEELWKYLNKKYPNLKKQFKIANITNLPRFISVPGYLLAQKIYKFN